MSIFNTPAFFEHNDFFIDEKPRLLNFTNAYKVFDSGGNQIGSIQQHMPAGLKFLSLLINRGMFPFKLTISDQQGQNLATLKRGWTFFMSKIEILDSHDQVVAHINQKFKFFKPTFLITDLNNELFASITGDWKAWKFTISGAHGEPIGTISKKWNGVLKEAFTTADKYIVSIAPEVQEDAKKTAIVAAAITVDMVLKGRK